MLCFPIYPVYLYYKLGPSPYLCRTLKKKKNCMYLMYLKFQLNRHKTVPLKKTCPRASTAWPVTAIMGYANPMTSTRRHSTYIYIYLNQGLPGTEKVACIRRDSYLPPSSPNCIDLARQGFILLALVPWMRLSVAVVTTITACTACTVADRAIVWIYMIGWMIVIMYVNVRFRPGLLTILHFIA